MDLNSLLAGLAGGLGGAAQGMQNVQDDRLKQAQQRMQQQQIDMQTEQQKRRAVMEARQLLSGGMTVQPELLAQMKDYPELFAGIEKQPDGQFVVQKSKQEMLIDQQIAEHERSVKEKQEQDRYREQAEAMGADFFNLSDAEKVAWQNKIGDPKFAIQTPEQLLQHNATLEKQRLAAQSAADVARIRASGQMMAAQTRQAGQNQLSYEDAARIVMADKDITGQMRYKLGTQEFDQAVAAIMARANAVNPTTTPAVGGVRRPSSLQRIQ